MRRLLTLTALLGGVAALAACSPPPEQKAAAPAASEAAGPPAPKPLFTVNEMMVMIVDHPGELLWDTEKAGHGPKTEEDWYQLGNHAVELASAATLIKMGGTGGRDMEWAKDGRWQTAADHLASAALAARAATGAKDKAALVTANGQIVDACEECHKAFKPEIPTGGLFLHHPLSKTTLPKT